MPEGEDDSPVAVPSESRSRLQPTAALKSAIRRRSYPRFCEKFFGRPNIRSMAVAVAKRREKVSPRMMVLGERCSTTLPARIAGGGVASRPLHTALRKLAFAPPRARQRRNQRHAAIQHEGDWTTDGRQRIDFRYSSATRGTDRLVVFSLWPEGTKRAFTADLSVRTCAGDRHAEASA